LPSTSTVAEFSTDVTAVGADGDVSTTRPAEHAPINGGTPGASARLEFERRHAKRQARIEAKWGTGRLGRIAKRLSDDPQTTNAWAQGAAGEERVAEILHERSGERAVLLHDRHVPRSRANIDHLAIAASGVWVIDAKRYKGKVEKRDVGGFFRTDVRLYVGGRDRTKTIAGLGWQVEAVRSRRCRCRGPRCLELRGGGMATLLREALRSQRRDDQLVAKLADLLLADGPVTPSDVEWIARLLADGLPTKT
jgi:hypothetical protein